MSPEIRTASTPEDDADPELVAEFLGECGRSLDSVSRQIALGAAAKDAAILALTARILHTIKGTAGFVGLPRIAATSHAAEGILAGKPPEAVDVGLLLVALNWIRGLVTTAADGAGREPAGSDDELIALIEQRGQEVANDNPTIALAAGGVARAADPVPEARERLVPLAKAFGLLPTVAAGAGRELGRPVDLKIDGASVRVNSRIVAALGAPLVQLVRNAVRHGIENASERTAQAKPPTGEIRIGARIEAGDLVVEVADDGRGFDTAAIGDRAVKLGLVDAAGLAALSRAEIARLAFHPGLSTAGLSQIAGRGIGLDIVADAVQSLGGKLDLRTQPGKGTVFTLRLPAAQRVAEEEGGSERTAVAGARLSR